MNVFRKMQRMILIEWLVDLVAMRIGHDMQCGRGTGVKKDHRFEGQNIEINYMLVKKENGCAEVSLADGNKNEIIKTLKERGKDIFEVEKLCYRFMLVLNDRFGFLWKKEGGADPFLLEIGGIRYDYISDIMEMENGGYIIYFRVLMLAEGGNGLGV